MNSREKRLTLAVLALAGTGALALAAHTVLVRPLRTIETRTHALQGQLASLKKEKREHFDNEETFKSLAGKTFADVVNLASARSGEWLTRQILAAGLPESDFTRLPLGPQKMRGAQEIGWNIAGSGQLDRILNLVFLLEESPVLHRIENLTLSPADGTNRVKASFRFLTLVIDPPQDVAFIDPKPAATLDSPRRKQFDVITARNLLLPYIPPPPPAPQSNPGAAPASPPPPSAPGPESFRVVSLSQWQGQSEIHIRDTSRQTTARYKPGDALADGVIVMVDYRQLPRHGREWLLSASRVILKGGTNYYAIDEGATLAEKYALTADKLPERLANK